MRAVVVKQQNKKLKYSHMLIVSLPNSELLGMSMSCKEGRLEMREAKCICSVTAA